MKLFDTTLERLQSSLDIRLQRQNVLNGNLANVDTPGYRPRDLDFNAAMKAASAPHAERTPVGPVSEGHIPVDVGSMGSDAESFVKTVPLSTSESGLDGNGVDLDKTMVELARNSLLYGASAKAANKKLAILKYVASDGVG